ncbi:MAG: hypothetical protein A2017_08730 [Lentisphaerae bacterium GWF2_44_16]|nr:MAG: hypothetical protein A2017_08730 [Lentisphaerae bacterium GWF2_44_16]
MTLKSKIAPHITSAVDRLQQSGFETYIVGGAVRDFLIGREPKDYDISTAASPEQVKDVFGKRRTFIIGRRFRLVQLFHGEEIIEISTFRREPSKEENRPLEKHRHRHHPENMIFHDNEFGSSEEDAWRRDFTVNAIFYDPIADKIMDHTGLGVTDLNSGIVRAIGTPLLRFEEDPVRILRALKLAGQYGFKLEEETEKALFSSLSLILHASGSRLSLELEKILKNPYSDKIFNAFYEYGFLQYFLPNLQSQWESEVFKYSLELLTEKNRRVLDGSYRQSISLTAAAMVLPFIEASFGSNGKSGLWNNFAGIEDEIRRIILKLFNPRVFTKRMQASTIRTLLLQPKFKRFRPERLLHHHGYAHARELLMIQNNLTWKDPQLPEKWPSGKHSEAGKMKHKHQYRAFPGRFRR